MTRRLLLAALVAGVTLAGCVQDNPVEPAIQPPPDTTKVLIHYWDFNALPEGTITAPVAADYSVLSGANITYPGTGDGYMDRIDGSELNLRRGAIPGFALRARNPANTRELLIAAPSTGYEKLIVRYAAVRTANGALSQEFYYSANAGATWTKAGETITINLEYTLYTFDLSAIAAVNNNPNLRFRILQTGDAAAGASGNNRFDNFTVEGEAASGPPVPAEPEVVHYWHFNALPEGTLADPIAADVSKLAGASVSYPGTGTGFADRVDGTDVNAETGVPPGFAYRARNPASTRELIIAAPSTGYKNIVVSYAATRTSSGAQTEEFYYSTDGGGTWVQFGEVLTIAQDVFNVYTFDLTAVAAVNNNASLRFRVLQTGAAAAGASGNNRFDNIKIVGTLGN
jgi:hypothetical protein